MYILHERVLAEACYDCEVAVNFGSLLNGMTMVLCAERTTLRARVESEMMMVVLGVQVERDVIVLVLCAHVEFEVAGAEMVVELCAHVE